MVKKKITKKAVDAEEVGSIGGYHYKMPTKGKGKPKDPAKAKPVPKKTQIAPEKSKEVPKKAVKIPEKGLIISKSDKPESEKAKIVPKKAKIVPKKADTNFSPEQKQDVEEIGFGGLLHLKLKTLNRQMLPWLVENFNAGSCMFTIATGKEFVVTRNDICDVFCLPLSDICVPQLNKNSEDESVDKRIIQAWRSDYGLSGKKPLHLSKLESRMVDLVDGGEEFKSCFVLQAMSSFLAPTTNRTVSLKLLKAVEKVDEIKTFDWCSYVLKKLKKVVQKYKYDETAQNGLLDTFTYPVSQLNFRETVFKPAPTLGYDKGASTSGTTGRIVAFELPEVSQTELLLSNPHYLKILDGLIDECNKMKSVHDLFCGFYEPTEGNKDVVPKKEPSQCFNENIPKDDDNGHGKIVNEGLNGSGPSAIIPGPTENIPVGHIDQNEPPRRIFRANKSLCSLDCGPVGNISSAVKDLHDLWEGWVSYENPECDIMDADLIYFPVLIENHYIFYVNDHTKELCVQMGAFLGKRNHPKSSQLPSYGFEVVELEWRKEKVDNLDCGVFVMNDVLSELHKFNEKKKDPAYVNGIEERLKVAIAAKKKRETEERKMAAEAEAKAEGEEEKTKGKRAKKQAKKFTPSK
uniref:Ubiquitin-like protease family profile domain-containing protein n=1 Tax=Chenopodium quinoa TaxID=63459 RepID=A0A803MZA6_CHEQI